MSADLFAEFNELSNSPASTTPQTSSGQPAAQNQTPAAGSSQDALGPLHSFDNSFNDASPSQQQWLSESDRSNAFSSLSNASMLSTAPQAPASGAADDDDDWGDFETSEPQEATIAHTPKTTSQWAPPSQPVQWHNAGTQQSLSRQPQKLATTSNEPKRLGIVRADTLDLVSNHLVNIGDTPKPEPAPAIRREPHAPPQRPRLRQGPSDPNVLFDAGDFELEGGGDELEDDDDDDFGDFETVAPAPSQAAVPARPAAKPAPPSLDLLGLSLEEPPQPPTSIDMPAQQASTGSLLSFGSTAMSYPTAPKSPSYQQRNPFPELAIKTPTATEFDKKETQKSPSPVTAWPNFEEKETTGPSKYHDDEDEWGAWDDMPSGTGKDTVHIDARADVKGWDWDETDDVKPVATTVCDDAPPPINVPPPSVILSIFPDLFSSADKLFKPMSGQGVSIKDKVLSDSKVVDFLHGYILLATTAAHVIAGRKHRWHRDKILAKSMSISAAGSKGMKLAGVDKTQSVREDREAADVVAVWRDRVGRLRSAVAAANSAGRAGLKVPELNETMQVQTAKLAPTGLKACIICGLKREERVSKVDLDIEDSFGEWWVEHWGHRACKNFWTEHEQKLRQR